MSKVIACANTKGGVGKTTVALSLAECSANLGRRTLVATERHHGGWAILSRTTFGHDSAISRRRHGAS
jgi:anion-transporting  ArsA/GET3 family ATPase